jgi:hypothetical protein
MMNKVRKYAPGMLRMLLLLLAAAGCASALSAEEQAFMRLAEDAEGDPKALQVAIASYRDPHGRRLDLVGAVHVADREYFRNLDQRFEDYEVVLYELVGDPDDDGRRERAASPAMGLIGAMQGGMKDMLGLAFQLEEIDYEADNFVHADMTPDEFSASMRERDETWFGTFMQMWAASTAVQYRGGTPPEADLLKVFLADDRQLALKRMMARSLIDQEHVLEVLGGDEGSTLITERNRKALAVLERQLARGATDLALFYGAGHMADFHQRLLAESDFRLQSVEWIDAWDLTAD